MDTVDANHLERRRQNRDDIRSKIEKKSKTFEVVTGKVENCQRKAPLYTDSPVCYLTMGVENLSNPK